MTWIDAWQSWAVLPRFAALLALIFVVAGAAFLAATPALRRRKPELWREIALRILAWWFIAATLVASLALGRTAWIGLVALVTLLAFREYARAVGLWKDHALLGLGYGFIIAVHIVAWWPYPDFFDGPGWWGLYLVMPVWGVVAVMLIPVLRGRSEHMLQTIALTILGIIYFGFFLSHAAYLHNLSHGGVGLVLWLTFLVAVNDVSAFICGNLFGRTPLRVRLSPGKTVEGALGSLAVVVLVAWLLRWLVPFLGIVHLVIVAALISLAAVVGDLTTSVIKRDLGIKDWSQALPGHGGILDRSNSLVYASPIVLHYVVFFFGL